MDEAMKLYHFTSRNRVPKIRTAGQLTPTETNIGSPDPRLAPFGEHYAPDGVWFFDVPNPRIGDPKMLTDLLGVSKQTARFTVEVPDDNAIRWLPWAKEQGINPQWLKVLTKTMPPKHWFVVLRPVPHWEWERIEVRDSVDSPWRSLE